MADQPRLFIALYTDEDVTSELAKAVRQRGFSAQSAAEAGMLNVTDEGQLAYAAEHGMTILTYNARDFLRLAQHYASSGKSHAGIVISSEQYTRREFGQLLRLILHLINSVTSDEMRDRIVYLQQFGQIQRK